MYSVFFYVVSAPNYQSFTSTDCFSDMWPTDVSTTSFPLWLRHEADKDDTVEMDAMAIRVWSKWLLLTSWLYVNYAMGVTWTIWRFVMPSNLFKFLCRFHLKEFDPECDLYLPTLEMYDEHKHAPSKINIWTWTSPAWRGNHLPNLHSWLPC